MTSLDVIVIGGGQAGLAVAHYLRRTRLTHIVLDAAHAPGGAWRSTWPTLRLFSPADASSLPGWPMPAARDTYPTRDEVVEYLTRYEQRVKLPVQRPVRVAAVRRAAGGFAVVGESGTLAARAVVSATGTAGAPYVPSVPGQGRFTGRQLHSVDYGGPEAFAGQRVAIVGAGNSAAQILAEVSRVADTIWAVREPPRFMADDVDGRAIFTEASRRYREGNGETSIHDLGDIVMVPSVKEARGRGVLAPQPLFERLVSDGAVWPDGRLERLDAIIWCTGFHAALDHLAPLDVLEPDGHVLVDGTRARREPRLWLVGYGGWTGFASATLIGVGRTARRSVEEIDAELIRSSRAAGLSR
jgi:putative flavoprotein involved in K+ transport